MSPLESPIELQPVPIGSLVKVCTWGYSWSGISTIFMESGIPSKKWIEGIYLGAYKLPDEHLHILFHDNMIINLLGSDRIIVLNNYDECE